MAIESGKQIKESALLVLARSQGTPDPYGAKRAWKRYSLGVGIRITTDINCPSNITEATLYNISGGGVGFWSKQEYEPNTLIYVYDGITEDDDEWRPARVRHCTVGLRGFLVGAAFENPYPTDEPAVTDDLRDGFEIPREERRTFGSFSSIRTRCCVASALACAATLEAAYAASQYGTAHQAPFTFGGVALAAACFLGTIFTWVALRRDVIFQRKLHTALRRLAVGQSDMSALPPGASRESDLLKQSFEHLASRWDKREFEERVQRQRVEEIARIKTNILSIVSHDLRTPLTSILMYTHMLKDDDGKLESTDRANFLDIICDECNRLSRLVDDLLDAQHLDSERLRLDLQPRDLAQTIRSCAKTFEPLAKSRSVTLEWDCPESLPLVAADIDKIAQAINNLVSNALKFTPSGGSICILATKRGSDVVFRVQDTGPGIPRDKWDQIFDRFAQISDPNVSEISGFGLGLYIVRRIIEEHGGIVWVDSDVGRGSEFYVSLPTIDSVKSDTPMLQDLANGCRVLICDSDPELVAVMSHTLRCASAQVRSAHSGGRLLAQLASGDIDVVVTDLLLPDLNAEHILENLSQSTKRKFRLIVHSYEGDRDRFHQQGVDVFLKRPVSKEELIQAVQHVMYKNIASDRIVVLVNSEDWNLSRLEESLRNAGNAPVRAASLIEAGPLVENYGADLVLVPSSELVSDWSNLNILKRQLPNTCLLIVLCPGVTKMDRRLADTLEISVASYRAGEEDNVVNAVEVCTRLEVETIP